MLPRLALPPSHAVLVLIALAFVAPGLVGHDPWRAFDVIAIEIVNQMHLSGDWVVPRIAGEPYLEDPPLFHWIALAFAKGLGWALGLHNAVRLASGLSVMAALWFIYLAARHTAPDKPRAAGASATLLLIGSVGLMVHAHEAVPDLASLAALCAALAFLVHAKRRPVKAGLGFGAALGCAFLATGPLVPAVLGAVALLAHAACDEWRTAKAPVFLGIAAAVFALFALSWPLALWLRAPDLVPAWWLEATRPRGGFGENLRYYLSTASWFAWPAWPVAAWSAWTLRREWRTPRVFVPLTAAILALFAVAWLGPQQDINVIVLLAPLALLGAHGVARLRRGAANALDWFGVMTFSFFAGLIWLGYVAMMTGVPPKVANNFAKTAPGYLPQFEPLHFAIALALTAGWLYFAFFSAPSPTRGVTRWAAGTALLWGCFATLLLPWADHIKSYRGVALQLKAALPGAPGCISQSELAAPQRAAFSYHAGLRTEPLRAPRVSEAPECRYLIVQGSAKEERSPGPGWRKVAEANRPANRGERYRLYRYGPE
jgi:4-amino-4-deoxy-L-arabinose transferase-like glycosyltransferase